MTLRALLIGSQTGGLSGCNADVALIRDALAERGFNDVQVLIDKDATRAGILAGFACLTEATVAGDAALVYYSGHGGRFPLPDWEQRQADGRDAFAQFIVPYDMDLTTETDFRGLLSLELSDLQSVLTSKTDNVTTILDCCHSGLMSRDATLVPKAVSRDIPIDAALAKLAELEERAGSAGADGNPMAVRVVACAPNQSAYEAASQFRPGESHGLLTDALAHLLRLTDAPAMSWHMLGERLRTIIRPVASMQRPEVEGPSRRLPFTLEESKHTNGLPVQISAGEVWVLGADLLGVVPGDQYLLLDVNDNEIGTVVAQALSGSRVRLKSNDHRVDLSAAVIAVPKRTSSPLPVAVDLQDPLRTKVLSAIEGSVSLLEGEPAVASVTDDNGLIVLDSAQLPLHAGNLGTDAVGIRKAIGLLENLAGAYRFRSLTPADEASRLAQQVDVEFRLHVDGQQPSAIAGSGERLFEGDKVSVKVCNRGAKPVFFWLFDVGVGSTINLVTDASPSGRRLEPAGQPGDTGSFGGPEGPALQWPAAFPTDGGRAESFVVIVADREQDLSVLQTRRALVVNPSPLEQAVAEASTGVRDWPAELNAIAAAPLRYRVDTCDIVLQPGKRPLLGEAKFALDQRPDISLRMLTPRTGASVPQDVAVRLVRLSVLNNKALLRATVRLDAMVITGSSDGKAVATPFTQIFPGIADRDHLPMDNLLLYAGPVRDFVDIAIWVNRADDKGSSLAELFVAEVNKASVASALTVAGGLIFAAPQVAVGVGAVVAVAELVRVGARLVSAAVGKDIGLYRTSLLPHEGFGVGRHPETGMLRAQQIEFAYEVREQP